MCSLSIERGARDAKTKQCTFLRGVICCSDLQLYFNTQNVNVMMAKIAEATPTNGKTCLGENWSVVEIETNDDWGFPEFQYQLQAITSGQRLKRISFRPVLESLRGRGHQAR